MDILDLDRFLNIASLFSDQVESGMKELLEKKHLYQRISVKWPDPEVVELKGSRAGRGYVDVDWIVFTEDSKTLPWVVANDVFRRNYLLSNPAELIIASPIFIPIVPLTIKIYCHKCEEMDPFNIVDGLDVFSDVQRYGHFTNIGGRADQQIFVLKYQCQNCKTRPVVFLIQRDGLKISLTGREPMEMVLVPKFIPKEVEKYYSGAMIAYNSGQILPAKFMFRVFLEQYVRSLSKTPKSEDIEGLFMEYKSNIPNDFKQRFPSLDSIYQNLSDHIHAADETPEMVMQVKEKIDLHFESKKIFERTLNTNKSTGEHTSNVNSR